MRKKVIAGNWKMNNTLSEASLLTATLKEKISSQIAHEIDIILCVPYPYLTSISTILKGTNIYVGAQDCSQHKWGAYTGEVSTAMLNSLSVTYVIIGHSERRQYFGEDEALLSEKINRALEEGLNSIFCCGEPLEVREKNHHESYVTDQITKSLFHLDHNHWDRIIIAYEPIWAIGTGKTATEEEAQHMHAAIRQHLANKYNDKLAQQVPILYGGSVKPRHALSLFSSPDIDGGLIGGASLKADEFLSIIQTMGSLS